MAIASIKSKGGWNGERKFCLGISVGQNHTGEALSSVIDWLNKSSFNTGIIDLSDTLNRYNFMRDGMSEGQAKILSRQQGDKWLSDNDDILKKLERPVDIIRWDNWLNDPEYEKVHAQVVSAYQQSLALQHGVLKDIKKFIERKGSKTSETDYALCRAYLLEEITGHSILYRTPGVAAVYPGKQLESYKAIRSGVVSGISEGLVHSPFVRLVVHSFDRPLSIERHLVA